MTATDPDGSVLEYSITGGDTDQQFTIDSVTGQIATRRRLDFESVSSYRLTVQVFVVYFTGCVHLSSMIVHSSLTVRFVVQV